MVTFLFTDIEGSTRLFHRLGEGYERVLADHHRLIRDAVRSWRGAEVGTQGDSFFVAFADAADALAGAAAIQQAISAHRWPPGNTVRVRIGIHSGPARAVDGDYVALAVHQAARVETAAHGAQVLVSAATAALTRDALPANCALLDLGEYRLKDFDEPQRLYQLRHPDLRETFPPVRAPAAGATNLPRQRTSFVGREDALAEVRKALAGASLVTLIGGGGLGKTRTALQAAADARPEFAGGVWFVDLASISDPRAIEGAFTAALSAPVAPGQAPLDAVVAALGADASLLLVDNCEHIIDAAAVTINELLSRCEHVTVLATSREPLRVADEQVVRLSPMALPDAHGDALTRPLDSDAVRLFAARAARARHGFTVSADNAPVVIDICRRVEGIPLALELAAARLTEAEPHEVAAALADRLGTLTGGLRTADQRQQTLLATLDWSYDLLSAEERAVLDRLSVFAGSFDHNAAADITAFGAVGPAEVKQAIDRLVDHSLLDVDESGSGPRFRVLEIVREYGAAHLAADGEAAYVGDRHASFYVGATAGVKTIERVAEREALDVEYPNLMAALAHLRSVGSADQHGRLVTQLAGFWDLRGHWQTARREFEAYLERPDRDPAFEPHIRRHLGNALSDLGDTATAAEHLRAALEGARRIGDRRLEGAVVGELGGLDFIAGDYARAKERFEEALAIAREVGNRSAEGNWSANLGGVALDRGDLAEARRRFTDALEVARELGERRYEGNRLGSLGFVAADECNHDEARTHLLGALEIAREMGERRSEGNWVGSLGVVASNQGNYEEARDRYEEALSIARELGDRQLEGNWVGNLGGVAWHLGDMAAARANYGAALELARELGERKAEMYWQTLLGKTAQREGRDDEARQWFVDALRLGLEIGTPSVELLNACAALLDSLGRADEAAGLRDASGAADLDWSATATTALRSLSG